MWTTHFWINKLISDTRTECSLPSPLLLTWVPHLPLFHRLLNLPPVIPRSSCLQSLLIWHGCSISYPAPSTTISLHLNFPLESSLLLFLCFPPSLSSTSSFPPFFFVFLIKAKSNLFHTPTFPSHSFGVGIQLFILLHTPTLLPLACFAFSRESGAVIQPSLLNFLHPLGSKNRLKYLNPLPACRMSLALFPPPLFLISGHNNMLCSLTLSLRLSLRLPLFWARSHSFVPC